MPIRKKRMGWKNTHARIVPILLFVLVIFFVIATGCTEAAEDAGESAVRASGDSGSSASNLIAPGVNAVATAINSNTAGGAAPISIVDETRTVPYEHMVSYLLAGDQGYQFNIGVTSIGGPVDVLVLDESNYQIYSNAFKQNSAVSFTGVTYPNVVTKNFQYILPAQGTYYLVIENAPFLTGGADAGQDVVIRVNVELIR